MSNENFVTCRCQYCNKGIEFNAEQLEVSGSAGDKITGQTTTCPHCGMDTLLFIPREKTPEPIAEKPPEKIVKLVKQTFQSGGMEDTLDEIGGIVLVCGIVGGIIAIFAAIIAFSNSQVAIGVDLLCVGLVTICVASVNRILFRAGAELIRLLKKLNGLKYAGSITQPVEFNVYKCSSCSSPLGLDQKQCFGCGGKISK